MSLAIDQHEQIEQPSTVSRYVPTLLMAIAVALMVLGLDLLPGIRGFNGLGTEVISVILLPGKYWFLCCFGLAAGLASLNMARKSEHGMGALALSGVGVLGLALGLFISGELALHRYCTTDFNPPACAGEPFEGVTELEAALAR